MSTAPGWYLWDYDDGGVLRGPYSDGATAEAVRTEMERQGDGRDIWIVDAETVVRFEADLTRAGEGAAF
jgi:hypothetical protein